MSLIQLNSISAKNVIDQTLAFTAPRIVYGSSTNLVFYAFDGNSSRMRRKRIRLDHLGTEKAIRRRETEIIGKFTQLLFAGWTPWAKDVALADEKTDALLTQLKPRKSQVKSCNWEKAIKDYLDAIKAQLERKTISNATHMTYNSYCRSLNAFLDEKKVDDLHDIDLPLLNQFLNTFSKCSVKYCNSVKGFLKTLFTWFVVNGYLPSSPADGLKKETIARTAGRETLTDAERNTLFERLRKDDRREFLLACMMEYYCYIRPNELYRLKVENLNLEEQSVFIPAAISKNKRDGKVTLPAEVVDLMVELGVASMPGNYYIFGDRMQCCPKLGTPKQFGRYWDNHVACKGGLYPELKKRGIVFYSLKNTGITDMLESGVASITVRDQARHSNISTTEIYARQTSMTAPAALKNYKGK